jgi:hypothetical protein
MDRRNLLEIMATAALGFVVVGSGAVAQQKSIKDHLVGAWTLLIDDGIKPDGTHVPTFGPNPLGALMFIPNGRFDEAAKTINFRIEGSSFPNWENGHTIPIDPLSRRRTGHTGPSGGAHRLDDRAVVQFCG